MHYYSDIRALEKFHLYKEINNLKDATESATPEKSVTYQTLWGIVFSKRRKEVSSRAYDPAQPSVILRRYRVAIGKSRKSIISSMNKTTV